MHGSQSRFPTQEVALWLDSRKIPRNALLSGERSGATYGMRFRLSVGLPRSGAVDERPDRQPKERLNQELWIPLEQLLQKTTDPTVFEAVVMSLLCIRGTDALGWTELAMSSSATIRETLTRVRSRQPARLANATAALQDLPGTPWWCHHLVKLVFVIGSVRIHPAEAFDYLIDRFAQERHHSRDEYLLPAELAGLMVEMLDPKAGTRVHDPCCGAGGMLVATANHVGGDSSEISTVITGRAATTRTWRMANINIALRDMQVDLGDGPAADPQEVDAGAGPFDTVLLNPPFGMRAWHTPTTRHPQSWPYGEPSPHDPAFAWVQSVLEALAPAGRAAVVMPSQATFARTGREHTIRRNLVEGGVVRCVVGLPDQLFRETTVPVTIWFLSHPDHSFGDEVLLIDARSAARRERPTHRMLSHRGRRAILDAYRYWVNGAGRLPTTVGDVRSAVVPVTSIRDHGYDLQAATYLDQHRAAAASNLTDEQLRTLPRQISRLDLEARTADSALERRLRELTPWTR
ncbi:class I SAM-dependent DNA methyltransferase [Asanoa sp. NPDC049518]|uniref:HsdM family class I SAM-dependent methyltransferase n=1 Tax=unclassified Asanoa TaxID=2685164 RepID=UPI003433F7CD